MLHGRNRDERPLRQATADIRFATKDTALFEIVCRPELYDLAVSDQRDRVFGVVTQAMTAVG